MPERPRRAWPLLDPALFASALVAYAAGVPLGLDRIAAASKLAAAVALDTTWQAQGTALALLATRLVQYLPLGDLATRANLAAALLGALAVMLVGRLCVDLLGVLRPPAHARQGEHHFVHEPLVAAGAALSAGMALATFSAATSAGAAAATLALLAAAWLAALPLLRAAGSARHGFALALLAGLAAGVDPVAGPLLWPLASGLWLWELRRRERWPLWAPLGFVAAFGACGLATVAASGAPIGFGGLLGSLWPSGTHAGAALAATSFELADELGVVGLLLGAAGLLALLARAPLLALWFGFTLVSALLLGHAPARGELVSEPARAALPAALLAAALPIAVGIVHVAGKLGRARIPAAIVLAAMALVSPALDGGDSRWTRDSHTGLRLLGHGLGRVPIHSHVDPGTPEMEGLFRYGQALGLRPELEIAGVGPRPEPEGAGVGPRPEPERAGVGRR